MLTKKQANKIVAELREQKLHDDEEILEHLKSSDITKSKDVLKIIDAMLQNEPYFNFFIGNNFVNLSLIHISEPTRPY